MIYYMDLLGVAVFAVTGSLAAGRKRMDGFGVLVLAMVTAIGGGTVRDLLLGASPVFWIADQTYVWVAVGAAAVTMLTGRWWISLGKVLAVADAFGLAIFAAVGAQHALALGAPGVVVVLMGVMTGVAGGIIRDTLANEVPFVFRSELYATATMAGAGLLLLFHRIGMSEAWGITIAAVVCLIIRLAAIRWRWSLPIFHLKRDS